WLKIIRVGTPRTPYFCGTPGFSSMLIFAMVTFSPSSVDSSSSAGAIMRHGPHHSAQKSTTTGFLELRTSVWKEASVILTGADMWNLWKEVSGPSISSAGGPGIKLHRDAREYRA